MDRVKSNTKTEPHSSEYGTKEAKPTERPPNLLLLPPPKTTPPAAAPAPAERSPDPANQTGLAAKAAANPPTPEEAAPKPCEK